jgi:CheY-like chemotaxis protein
MGNHTLSKVSRGGGQAMGLLGGHALIIEDEMLIALEVENLLSDLGFETFDIARTPHEAVSFAEAHRPDLITADYRIEDGTGLEAVRSIQASIGAVPVVYVTGNADALKGERASEIIEKPILPGRLAAACRRACHAAAGESA